VAYKGKKQLKVARIICFLSKMVNSLHVEAIELRFISLGEARDEVHSHRLFYKLLNKISKALLSRGKSARVEVYYTLHNNLLVVVGEGFVGFLLGFALRAIFAFPAPFECVSTDFEVSSCCRDIRLLLRIQRCNCLGN
jgi:hypothetical protein